MNKSKNLAVEQNILNKIYLLGAGPSLNSFDFSRLEKSDFMIFNRMYISNDEFPKLPTYHVIIDQTVLKDNKEDIKYLIENNTSTTFFLRDIDLFSLDNRKYFGEHKNLIYFKTIKNNKKINTSLGKSRSLKNTKIINKLDYFGDAGCFGLQLCYHMGYSTVYLAGIDSNFKDNSKRKAKLVIKEQRAYMSDTDDYAHYRKDYYGKGKLYTKETSNKQYIWKSIKRQKIPNFNIINVCSDSILEVFKKE